MLSKKVSLLVLALTVMLAVAIAGCAPAPATPAPAAPEVAPPKEEVTITILIGSGNHIVPAQRYADEFTEKTGIKVRLVDSSHTELYEKALVEFIAETGAYDAVEYLYTVLGDFAEGGYLRPIDDYIEKYNAQPLLDDYLPVMREMYTRWGGKTYGLVYDGDIHSYYYRKDLFTDPEIQAAFKEQFGYDLAPATTWDQYLDIAKFFSETDYVKYGVSELARRGRMYLWWGNRFFGMGGVWFDEEGKPAINSEAGVKALENFIESIKYAPPGVLQFEFSEHEGAWVKGEIPQFVQWPDAWKDALLAEESVLREKGTDALGIALTPGGHPILATGWAFAFPKAAKHTEEAFQFIKYITEAERSVWSVTHPESGIDPYLVKGHFENPEVQEVLAPEFLEGLKISIREGRSDLRIPHAAEFLDVLDLNLSRALAGEVGAQEALDATAQAWTDLLQKHFNSPTLPDALKPMLELPK